MVSAGAASGRAQISWLRSGTRPRPAAGFHGGESQPCVGSREETGNGRHLFRTHRSRRCLSAVRLEPPAAPERAWHCQRGTPRVHGEAADSSGVPSVPSREEPTHAACKGTLEDAVICTRGHIFCRLCLPPPSRMGARPSCQVLPCVLCKQKEPTQPLMVPVPLGPLGETCCEEHGEKIYFFCEIDAELLCVVCRESPSHCTHPAAVLNGAVQPYRDHLWSQLKALRLEKSKMEATWQREDRKLQELLTHIESKKQQVDAAFGKLQQELADQHGLLQARLRELELQTCMERDQYNSKFSEEITRLGAQAQELEEQSQQPASVLLQDVRADQSRYETRTFVNPETISPDLVKKIRDFHRKTLSLPEMLRTFSENLAHHLETDSGPVPPDPRALSRSLALPEDRKPATFTRDKQDLMHSTLRSEGVPAALGTPRLSLKAPPQGEL
ncbi:LOW QUALITY PROTEIN: tripartite motif-containing protein 15 [Enhydra lutris kenyoni]|uniref:LOW QUALITY PROTEIN: tripartite motif-containing protein 15 n=1 Tax=Enhydra lutris kenyoni TaxID=391180 RepID=A0A2Y9ID59_ENHLU|nr:LOW QUALITY PROTEIN: tripartite motif-containing protein 15 [Enhydra lutris kenyoni]